MKLTNYADAIEYIDLTSVISPGKLITVLYGEFGKRKTTTACSMIKNKGLLISADGTWIVLLKPEHRDLRDKVTIVEYEGLSQLERIDYSPYDTIILDTANEVVDQYLDMLYDKADWGGKFRERINTKEPELKGTTIIAQADYRVLRDKLRPVIRKLLAQPAHVIFTAHVTEPVAGLTTDLTKRPNVPPSIWKILGRLAHIIGYIDSSSKGFTINVDEGSTACVGKSQVLGISGRMSLDTFVNKYKEL